MRILIMPAPNSINTTGIILKRINFGEADRILSIITPNNGKLRLIAKGVRKSASKLAGGIELFSVSNISYIAGKKDIGTLISTKLVSHYSEIVKDISRTNTAYTLLTTIDNVTEDNCGVEYYNLLLKTISSLNNININIELIEAWFYANLTKILGHEPNLITDKNGYSLAEKAKYNFDYDLMCFDKNNNGQYSSSEIKLLRLLGSEDADKVSLVQGIEGKIPVCLQLLQRILQTVS